MAISFSLLAACSGARNEGLNHDLDTARRDAGDSQVNESDAEPEPEDASEASQDAETDAAQDAAQGEVDAGANEDAAAIDGGAEMDAADAGLDATVLDAEADSAALDAAVLDGSDEASLDADAGDAALADAADSALPECDAAALGSRIEIVRDTAGMNPERISSLRWVYDDAGFSPNVVGESVGACSASSEIFGHALTWPEGNQPLLVSGLTRGTMTSCGLDSTTTTGPTNCSGAAQLPVTTSVHLYTDARATQMRITRTFGFSASTPKYANTVVELAYVPRVKLSLFPTVIYPNAAGTAVTSVAANMCGGGCAVPVGTTANTSWNGAWFADVNNTTGDAIIVLRDPRMTSPVQLVHNWDAFSNSNLAAFGLVQPADGWKEPLTEIEYLCFADSASWPKSMRQAAQLPSWCVPD